MNIKLRKLASLITSVILSLGCLSLPTAAVATTGPSVTVSAIDISADTGSSATDFVTRTAAQTITATLSVALSAGEELYGSVNNGTAWTDITDKVTGTSVSWNSVTLAASNSIKLEVRDSGGTPGTAATQAYTLDTTAPTVTGTTPVSVAIPSKTVGTFSAIGSVTWALSGTNASLFNISTGGAVTFKAASAAGSYAITVAATDVAGNEGTKAVTVTAATLTLLRSGEITGFASGKGTLTDAHKRAISNFLDRDVSASSYTCIGRVTNELALRAAKNLAKDRATAVCERIASKKPSISYEIELQVPNRLTNSSGTRMVTIKAYGFAD